VRTVPVKTLKARLSHYLRQVEAGETLSVTRNGRPIAWVSSPSPGRGRPTPEEWWEAGLREGWILPPEEVRPLPKWNPKQAREGGRLLRIVLQMRQL
jgi:prevent-host-death family protein